MCCHGSIIHLGMRWKFRSKVQFSKPGRGISCTYKPFNCNGNSQPWKSSLLCETGVFYTLNTSRSSYFFATRKYSRMRKARLAMSLCLFMYEVWLYRSRATFTQINIELLWRLCLVNWVTVVVPTIVCAKMCFW